MKNKLPLLTLITFNLFSCESITTSQSNNLDKMCDCMEENKDALGNEYSREILGKSVNIYAQTIGIACSAKVLNQDYPSYETIKLFKTFAESVCGKKYNIDSASINNSVIDVKKDLKKMIGTDDLNKFKDIAPIEQNNTENTISEEGLSTPKDTLPVLDTTIHINQQTKIPD